MCSEVELKLNELELSGEKCVDEFRNALKSSNIAAGIEFEDDFLLKFLRSRHFKVNESRTLLESYISLIVKYPYFFHGVDYSKQGFESGVIQVIKKPNFNGETVVIIDIGEWDPRQVTVHQLLAAIIYGLEVAALDESIQTSGLIGIVNMDNLGFKHMLKLGITEIQLAILILDYSLPIFWRKLIIANENAFTNIIFKVGRPFLSKEMKDRLVFVGRDMKILHEHVLRDILPEKFGGTAKQSDFIECFNTVKSEEQKLLKQWEPFKIKSQ